MDLNKNKKRKLFQRIKKSSNSKLHCPICSYLVNAIGNMHDPDVPREPRKNHKWQDGNQFRVYDCKIPNILMSHDYFCFPDNHEFISMHNAEHIFCLECSYFDVKRNFIAVVHLNPSNGLLRWRSHQDENVYASQLFAQYIIYIYYQDYTKNTLYLSFLPEEVMKDILEFLFLFE